MMDKVVLSPWNQASVNGFWWCVSVCILAMRTRLAVGLACPLLHLLLIINRRDGGGGIQRKRGKAETYLPAAPDSYYKLLNTSYAHLHSAGTAPCIHVYCICKGKYFILL